MLIEIMLLLLLGIMAGTLTGLIPGIHINLIGIFLISISTSFFFINPIYFIVFITSMAITHTFLDFIPSIFLGCPDTDTELSILPGHELLKKGQGYMAVILTAYGSLAAIFILILISYPSIFLMSKLYEIIKNLIPYMLIIISIILILLEKQKLKALFIFSLTGLLGICVLNLNLNQPLLPLLSGLFGSSMLIKSIKNKIEIPKQKIINPRLNLKKPIIGSLLASPLCSFLPGLGSSQAAVIANTITKTTKKEFLILLGATNTFVMGFSFFSLYTISKTRTGAAVAIKEIIGTLSKEMLILIITVILISGIIAFFLTKFLAKYFSTKITKINYSKISIITLTFLSLIIFLVSNLTGLFVFIIATATGIYSINQNIKRTNMMGCLIIPTIILYLF